MRIEVCLPNPKKCALMDYFGEFKIQHANHYVFADAPNLSQNGILV